MICMAVIRKRRIGRNIFYYLEHTLKIKGKVQKKEKYLGKQIPKNIEGIKRKFLNEIYKEKWYKKLDQIKGNFRKEFNHLPPEIREKYMETFMVRFTYDTNRIEGGSLTHREVATLLHDKITPANKPVADIKEAEAHKKLFYAMLGYRGDLNLRLMLAWHKLLFKDTKPNIAGRIRNYDVYISGSEARLPPWKFVRPLMNDFLKWYRANKSKLHPVELAALVHLKFVRIHPFGDGNGRISRILMNFVLHRYGFPMLNISYKNRSSYYTALERSDQKQDELIFVRNIINRYIKGYKNFFKSGSLAKISRKKKS